MKRMLLCALALALMLPAACAETIQIGGDTFLWDGTHVIEPDTDMDPYTLPLAEATDRFNESCPTALETYVLCPGETTETTVYKLTGEKPGKTVYIVAGVHGDERAAWFAGVLLHQASIDAGTLYILAPANAPGAKKVTRYVNGMQDLNRSFPGDASGDITVRLADAIFQDIRRVSPDMLLDLHEAIVYREGRDFLGSTLIYSSLEGMDELFFDLLFSTQTGEICSTAFGYNGPGPAGSINRTVTDTLHIPSITVETFRGYPMERRVRDQLDVVWFVLRAQGLLP